MLDKLKSKYILKKIFEMIKNKRKLNIIKYNKGILAKLNINKKDFETYINVKEFNNKYNTNIEDIDIKELNLSGKHIGNKGLKDLVKIKFKELNGLYLSNNEISDINILEKINFKELNILDLGYNQISDINILEKVNFKELKELNLSYNKISDINILEKVNFKKLKELNLCLNNISNINILEKVDFKELNILDLSDNRISDINVLEKVNFKKLKKLNLSNNPINEEKYNSILINFKSKMNMII